VWSRTEEDRVQRAGCADGLDRDTRAAVPVVADRLDYQADGAGLIGRVRAHLHVLDVAARRVRQVTSGDWHAGAPAWSPDSARLAFSAATAPDATWSTGRRVRARCRGRGRAAQGRGPADGTAARSPGPATARRSRRRHDRTPVGHAGLLRVPLGSADASAGQPGGGAESQRDAGVPGIRAGCRSWPRAARRCCFACGTAGHPPVFAPVDGGYLPGDDPHECPIRSHRQPCMTTRPAPAMTGWGTPASGYGWDTPWGSFPREVSAGRPAREYHVGCNPRVPHAEQHLFFAARGQLRQPAGYPGPRASRLRSSAAAQLTTEASVTEG